MALGHGHDNYGLRQEPGAHAKFADAAPARGAANLDEAEDRACSSDVQAPFCWSRFVALFLFVCALFVLRRPDALLHPQFWAEDGTLLFQSQLIHGACSSDVQAPFCWSRF